MWPQSFSLLSLLPLYTLPTLRKAGIIAGLPFYLVLFLSGGLSSHFLPLRWPTFFGLISSQLFVGMGKGGLNSKDIGDFIKSPKESYRKTKVLFISTPFSFPFPPVTGRFYFPAELCHIIGTMPANFPKPTFFGLAASLLKRRSLPVTLGKSPGVDSYWLSLGHMYIFGPR